jgi:hypothetical protein
MNWKFWERHESVESSTPTPDTHTPDTSSQLPPTGGRGGAAAFLADREKKETIRRVLIELVEQTKALTKQDIGKWRQAWQRAISVEWPSRLDLMAIYRDVEMDNHATGVFGQIFNEVLQKAYKIVDRDTEDEIEGLAKHLDDAQWFLDWCELSLDSWKYGYSPIQFGDFTTDATGKPKFTEVELLDREHFIPEHHVFVKHMTDHWKNGIDYTKPPYSHWVMVIGNKKDLGLYNKIARHTISKKNMEGFWDKFGQIFGMPLRIGKTSSSNPKDRNEVAEMLQKMGSAAWGVFPDGTDIEIKETTRGDAFEVYDKRIDRCNSEISKAVVHQTMTSDNGSSKSQSETHLTVQQQVVNYMAVKLRIWINDLLIPHMVAHGFKGWENAKFQYDDTLELTPEQQRQVEDMLLDDYEIDQEYFIEKYGVKIIGKKVAPQGIAGNPGNPGDPADPANPKGPNKTAKGFFDPAP